MAAGSGSPAPANDPVACAAASYALSGYVAPAGVRAYLVDPSGVPGLDPAQVIADVRAGFDTWNLAVNDCGLPAVPGHPFEEVGSAVSGASLARGEADGLNVVAFRSFGGGFPAPHNAAWAYFGLDDDGAVREWDIELDADLDWGTRWDARTYDIWNAVAHEAGHLSGLGHLRGGCGPELDPVDRERTMHPCIRPGQTSKRTLALGDWRGLAVRNGYLPA